MKNPRSLAPPGVYVLVLHDVLVVKGAVGEGSLGKAVVQNAAVDHFTDFFCGEEAGVPDHLQLLRVTLARG